MFQLMLHDLFAFKKILTVSFCQKATSNSNVGVLLDVDGFPMISKGWTQSQFRRGNGIGQQNTIVTVVTDVSEAKDTLEAHQNVLEKFKSQFRDGGNNKARAISRKAAPEREGIQNLYRSGNTEAAGAALNSITGDTTTLIDAVKETKQIAFNLDILSDGGTSLEDIPDSMLRDSIQTVFDEPVEFSSTEEDIAAATVKLVSNLNY